MASQYYHSHHPWSNLQKKCACFAPLLICGQLSIDDKKNQLEMAIENNCSLVNVVISSRMPIQRSGYQRSKFSRKAIKYDFFFLCLYIKNPRARLEKKKRIQCVIETFMLKDAYWNQLPSLRFPHPL